MIFGLKINISKLFCKSVQQIFLKLYQMTGIKKQIKVKVLEKFQENSHYVQNGEMGQVLVSGVHSYFTLVFLIFVGCNTHQTFDAFFKMQTKEVKHKNVLRVYLILLSYVQFSRTVNYLIVKISIKFQFISQY